MNPETVARWQFGITTVYHFFFVPVTIAMSLLVAVMQTMWVKTGQEKFLRLTKFYGKLFLINFAMGVVTGIVQEFQFGMNWSEYSRFVGDIFGAPLALEALLAFFLESTFIGLWIFGWDKLPKKLHLLSIWLVAIGSTLSAIFILAANSWMQNPTGATYNPVTDRAEMTDFGAVLTNPVFLTTVPHTLFAAYMVGGGLILATAGWHLAKIGKIAEADRTERQVRDESAYRWATKFGAWVLLIAGAGTILSGDFQGKVIYNVQPSKMAAAEDLAHSAGGHGNDPAPFSVVRIKSLDGTKTYLDIEVPYVLGFLAKNDPFARVEGIKDLEQHYEKTLGTPEFNLDVNNPNNELQKAYSQKLKSVGVDYWTPNVPISYWGFRIMIGLGTVAAGLGLLVLWMMRKGGTPKDTWWWSGLMLIAPLMPLFANSVGWIFTEMGRQPWIVAGVLPTSSAVSPGVSAGEMMFTLIGFTLIYGLLAVVEVSLFNKYTRLGLPEVETPEVKGEDEPLSFAY